MPEPSILGLLLLTVAAIVAGGLAILEAIRRAIRRGL